MSNTKITSEVCLISDVLYSGLFEVPWHQRYYDWKVEQVQDLLFDIKNALESGKTCYFLGSIMLVQATGESVQEINDGQQRLITLSLLIAALCRRFANKRPSDKSRETLALRALFDRSVSQTSVLTETSHYRPRITPPKSDHSKFTQIVRGHDIGTNGLLTAAWKEVDLVVEAMNKRERESFFDFIMQNVEISVLTIPKGVDAHSVFEALNARGKSLDDVDLIRNLLYSYFSKAEDTVRRDTVHNNLRNTNVVLRHTNKVQDYFRCYLQCRYGYLQKNRFYRKARLSIQKAAARYHDPSDHVFKLVADLGKQESIELFRTINSSSPSESLANSLPKASGKRDLLVLLAELGPYKVSHPLVFALLHRFIVENDPKKKKKVGKVVIRSLRNLAAFVMRTAFVATKFEPSKFEDAFANIANDVFKGKGFNSLDILEELKNNDELNVYSDANFISKMADVEIRDNQKALRYLFSINAQHQRGSGAIQKKACSVEHILPKSAVHSNSWSGFEDTNIDDFIYRTGNLVVVAKGENLAGDTFNRSYPKKNSVFADSAVKMARDVAAKYKVWTPLVIEERSKKLAQDAARIWSFSKS